MGRFESMSSKDTLALSFELDIDLTKYEKEVKKEYPFLSDEEIKEFIKWLYDFLLWFYISQIH